LRRNKAEKQLLQAGRRDMVRRFDEDVSSISQRQQLSRAKFSQEIRNNVVVGPSHEFQRNPLLGDRLLQMNYRLPYLGAGIVIEPGQDMRRARHNCYAVFSKRFCHIDGGREIAGSVVDARKDMAV
jgi:hypothetical protein